MEVGFTLIVTPKTVVVVKKIAWQHQRGRNLAEG
jgi:hypothetical protein